MKAVDLLRLLSLLILFAVLISGAAGARAASPEVSEVGRAAVAGARGSVGQIGAAEYVSRRRQLMDRLGDGIVLVHARSAAKAEDQPRFTQDAGFQYLTGLAEQPAAILALDAPRAETWLFVPPAPMSFGSPVPGLGAEPGEASARRLELSGVLPWDDFVPWLRQRLSRDPAVLYVDEPRRPEAAGNPATMPPVAGAFGLWRRSLAETFPEARIESALEALRELRWVKSPKEIEFLRDNAQATASALGAAAARIAPGIRQRQVEAAVVTACLEAGAQGPSFWPWAMSGPNAHVGRLVRAFFTYEHLDRTMEPGEVVRVDIGCANHGYGADVGRTLPVSGHFNETQAEVWELLTEGYLAGLAAMRAEVSVQDVRAASRARIRELLPGLRSDVARQAALSLDTDSAWHLHGVGIESGEEALAVLRAGTVLAYEPGVVAGPDAFYLEDMILVTESGNEVLSSGLPYSAGGIAELMQQR